MSPGRGAATLLLQPTRKRQRDKIRADAKTLVLFMRSSHLHDPCNEVHYHSHRKQSAHDNAYDHEDPQEESHRLGRSAADLTGLAVDQDLVDLIVIFEGCYPDRSQAILCAYVAVLRLELDLAHPVC